MLEMVMNFVMEWRFAFAFAGAVVGFAVLDWEIFKEKVYGLMLMAEKLSKQAILDSGVEQEDWVYEKIKVLMPKTVGMLGETNTRKLIKYLFVKAKDLLDDGQINGSYK